MTAMRIRRLILPLLLVVPLIAPLHAGASPPTFGGSDIMVSASTDAAGVSPSWTGTFDVATNSLQPFAATIAIPDDYAFNGFQALGPPDTQIGSMGFDFTMDGTPELTLPVLASEPPVYASLDLDRNGKYTDGVDPCIVMSQSAGMRFFDLLPMDSGLNPVLTLFKSGFGMSLTLYPGILGNPRVPGMYAVEATLVSVDPDSGAEDDFVGTAPQMANHMDEQTVTASAVSTIDPFLCYKGKASRGTLCSADAAANAGETCTGEADCGGTADVTAHCVKNRGPRGAETLLEDPLETKTAELRKSGMFCSPGHRSGQSTLDPTTHLRGYQIKDVRKSCVAGAAANEHAACDSEADCGGSACERTPRHEKRAAIAVQNELGITVVATKKPVEYLIPASAGSVGPVAPPGATALDHYKCYTVKFAKRRCAGDASLLCKRDGDCGTHAPCLRTFPKALSVSMDDTYTLGAKAFVLKKPTKLCLATTVDGAPPQSPDAHLLCYGVKGLKRACAPATGVPGTKCRQDDDCTDFFVPDSCQEQTRTPKAKGLYLANDLAVEQVDRSKETEICFPSLLLLS